MTFSNRPAFLALLAAPVALALAGCGTADDAAVTNGEPVAAIPAPDGSQWADTVTVTEADGYTLGNPDAPITLIEYASLTCPACAMFAAEAVEPLKNDYIASGRVKYELRNQIHGPHDLALATLVRCGDDATFHPLSEQVWANLNALLDPIIQNSQAVQQAVALPADQRLVRIAEIGGFLDFFAARGLSADQARSCLADETVYSAIAERSNTQSRELDVSGTPTFFVNNTKADANDWASVEQLLKDAGAR